MNKHKLSSFLLMLVDWAMALASWFLFFIWRKRIENNAVTLEEITADPNLIQGLIIIPLVWVLLFAFAGSYKDVLRASRLTKIQETVLIVGLGSVGLLFTVLSDDFLLNIKSYVYSFGRVFGTHLLFFLIGRMIYLSILKNLVRIGLVPWNVKVVGLNGANSIPYYYKVVSKEDKILDLKYNILEDGYDDIVIHEEQIEQLNLFLPEIIGRCASKGILINDNLWPELEHEYHLIPRVKMPYATLNAEPMMWWQKHVKRVGDIVVSIVAMTILSPLAIGLAMKIRSGSSGGIFYGQERLGRCGLPFKILKFRTMYENAELNGPALAQDDDERCTPIGRWMRKWRLDEIPQFYNVLRGDMSIVGPRPERTYYSEQLQKEQYLYPLLWQVRPGITSWGQIKFGYASTIKEMLQRFRFDLLYLQNRSLFLDLRILYYTVIVLLQGRGR